MSADEPDDGIHGAPTAPVGAGADAVASDVTIDLAAGTCNGDRHAAETGPATPCRHCAASTRPDERYCEACGIRLRGDRCTTTATRSAAAVRSGQAAPCPHCGVRPDPDDPDADVWCPSCGRRRPDDADHVVVTVDGAAAISDRGHVRPRNEDAVALGRAEPEGAAPEGTAAGTAVPVAAVVCDGVSSVPLSDRAARFAALATLGHLLSAVTEDPGHVTQPDAEGRIRAAVAAGGERAAAGLPPSPVSSAPSCTLVCGLVDPDRTTVTVGWVGDSRAYWLSADEPSRLLTRDHVAATAPPGTVDPVLAAARPDAITRWLGADGESEPDILTITPSGPGVLLLCTDGLWKYLPGAADLAAVALPALAGGSLAAATALVDAALAAGGEDNVTVAVISLTARSTP